MKKCCKQITIGLLIFISIISSSPLVAQTLDDYKLVTSEGTANAVDTYIDQSTGDYYLIGLMNKAITFRGWGSSRTLNDDPLTRDFFYAKANSLGVQHLYRISVQGDEAYISNIAVGKEYVYVLGSFTGSLRVFDSNGNVIANDFGSTVVNSNGNTDAFLLKIQKSNGQLRRSYAIGGAGRDFGHKVVIDNTNDVMIGGRFNGTVNFGLNFLDFVSRTSDGNDLYVVKYDSDDFFVDFAQIGGDEPQDQIWAMTSNNNNDIFISGVFNRSVEIGSFSLNPDKVKQFFVAKLDVNLNPQWLKLLESDSTTTEVRDLTFDEYSQNLYLLGRIEGNPKYDGTSLNTPSPNDDALLLKINSNNGSLVKSSIFGGNSYEDGKQITFDSFGNYFITGTFNNTFTISSNNLSKTTNGSTNSTFLAAFNRNDDIVYLNSFTSSNTVFGSRSLILAEGSELQLSVPLVYNNNVAVGLDAEEIIVNNSGNLDSYIGSYKFSTIPIIISGAHDSDNGSTDRFYDYIVFGINLGSDDLALQSRFVDENGNYTDFITPTSDGPEDVKFSIPTNIVAGISYRLEMNKSEYKDIFRFNTFSIPPDIHQTGSEADVVAGDNLNIPGRYFGNQTSGVSVSLVNEENGNVVPAQVSSVAPNMITISIPQAYPGRYTERVTVNGETTDGGNIINVFPQITEIIPTNNIPGGNMVINGNTFIDDSHAEDKLEVRLIEEDNTTNTIAITDFTSVEAEKITLKLPEDLADGTYQVEVETDGFVSNKKTITIENTNPVVNALLPTSGLVGDEITISGLNLEASTVKVTINGVEASLVTASDIEVKAVVPELEPGVYEVILALDEVAYKLADTFTVLAPPIIVNPLNVTSGVAGGEIIITGLNLEASTVQLTVDGVDAPIISASDTQIKATIPELEAGTYQVLLYLDGEEYNITDTFKIIFNKPVITEVDQDSVDIGTIVTVSGLNLNLATSVSLGSNETSFETVDNTTLKLTVPDLFPGNYRISISDQSGEEPATYESLIVSQKISSLSPSEVFSSSEITIVGSNFRSIASPPTIEVLLNDLAVDDISVNEEGTEISFMLTVSQDIINEEYTVKVNVNGVVVTADETILIKEDETAALVVSTFPSNALRKNEFNVSVQASDAESSIQKVEAAFAGIMDEAFGPFQEITPDESLYTLLTDNGDELGVKYQFKVTNGAGLEKIETGRTYWRYAENIEKVNRKSFTSAPTQQNYQLVAIPFKQQTVNAALGNKEYKKEDWRLFRLNQANTSENVYQEYNAGFTQFKAGEGYWLIAKEGILDSIKGDVAEPNEEGNIIIPVREGWNLIGNPFPFALDWSVVVSANPDIFLDQARLSVYNGSYNKEDESLSAYEGAFVNIKESGNLVIPFSAKAGNNQKQSNVEKEKGVTLDASAWQVSLSVHVSDELKEDLILGMHNASESGKDFYDADVFPSFFSSSAASFTREGLVLATDIIPPSSFAEWTVKLDEKVNNETVYLSWDNDQWVNNKFRLWLYDENQKQVIDMQAAQSYQFQPAASQHLKVLYGTEEALLRYVLPTEVQIGPAYPNPVVDEVNVTLMVPDHASGFVNWQLVDIKGRITKSGTIPLHYGIQKTSVQLAEKQGVYLLQFLSSEGEVLSQERLIIR